MFNSLTANRRLAFRMVAVQAAVALLVGLVFLFQDVRAALAAGVGGLAVASGSLVLAWRSMTGPATTAGLALARIVSGLVLKWIVVLGMLYVSLAQWNLPPLPLLCGLVAAMAASFLTHGLKA